MDKKQIKVTNEKLCVHLLGPLSKLSGEDVVAPHIPRFSLI